MIDCLLNMMRNDVIGSPGQRVEKERKMIGSSGQRVEKHEERKMITADEDDSEEDEPLDGDG